MTLVWLLRHHSDSFLPYLMEQTHLDNIFSCMYVTVMQTRRQKRTFKIPLRSRPSLDSYDMRVVTQALPSVFRILCDLRSPPDKALVSDKCPVIVIGGAGAASVFIGSPLAPWPSTR